MGLLKLKNTLVQQVDFLLANILPLNKDIKFSLVNRLLTKKNVSEVIDFIFRYCGQKETVIFCDRIKSLGF